MNDLSQKPDFKRPIVHFAKLFPCAKTRPSLRIPPRAERRMVPIAGWSSQVARQAHNLKVRGSNPLPATNEGR